MPRKFHLVTFISVFLFYSDCKANNAIDSLVQRYKQVLLSADADESQVKHWLLSLDNGRWPDIDYENKDRGDWKTREHLQRVRALSIAWIKPGNELSGSQDVLQLLLKAVDHWLLNKYQNSNWWHNEIGVPQQMRDIMILLKDHLSSRQWADALSVLGQLKVRGTGANLTWSADLGLHYAALTNNEHMIDSCRWLLLKEIEISTDEGVQPDFSFHQHGARLQNYHYGRFFLTDNTRLAWQCRNTNWAFPIEKVTILARLLLEGNQWMARGKHVSPAVVDRAVSRPGYLDTGNLVLTAIQLRDLLPEMHNRLETIIASYNGAYLHSGYKTFPFSDFASYNQKEFSFYLKTISTRTLSSETTINSENLSGHLLNAGNTYFIKNGKEYTDLMPVWNWKKLPGITNFNGDTRLERRDFNGGVSDGKSGCWASDHALSDSMGKLNAHKFWATYNNTMICLIAGMNISGRTDSIFTVMDQSRLQGKVEFDKPGKHFKNGTGMLKSPKWIYHAGFAYAPLYGESILLATGARKGSWHTINQSAIDTTINDSIFLPQILHTELPRASGYAVAAVPSAHAAANIFAKADWKILHNTSSCQAVGFGNRLLMVAFFEPVSLQWGNTVVRTDRPCIMQVDANNIHLSDPLHKGKLVNIMIGAKKYQVTLPETGETISIRR